MTAGTPFRIGLLRLTDAAPLIVAAERGYFAAEGFDVELSVEPSWANISDKLAYGLLDGAMMLRLWRRPRARCDFSIVPPADTRAALAEGRIDGFCAGAPWGEVAARAGLGQSVATSHAIWNNGTEKVFAVRHAVAEQSSARLQAVLRGCCARPCIATGCCRLCRRRSEWGRTASSTMPHSTLLPDFCPAQDFALGAYRMITPRWGPPHLASCCAAARSGMPLAPGEASPHRRRARGAEQLQRRGSSP